MFKINFKDKDYKISFESFVIRKVHPDVVRALRKAEKRFGDFITFPASKVEALMQSYLDNANGSSVKFKTLSQMVTRVSIWCYQDEKEIGSAETRCNPKDLPNRQVGKKEALKKLFKNRDLHVEFGNFVKTNNPFFNDILSLEFKVMVWDKFFNMYPKAKKG
jgi:hypothetical protein